MEENVHKENKIIEHFKRNRWRYVAGICFIGGFAVCYIIKRKPNVTNITNITNLTDSGVINNSPNSIMMNLIRRGHPGNVIECIETGERFASQNRCAEVMKITPNDLSRHLRGLTESVKNLHFKILGEAS